MLRSCVSDVELMTTIAQNKDYDDIINFLVEGFETNVAATILDLCSRQRHTSALELLWCSYQDENFWKMGYGVLLFLHKLIPDDIDKSRIYRGIGYTASDQQRASKRCFNNQFSVELESFFLKCSSNNCSHKLTEKSIHEILLNTIGETLKKSHCKNISLDLVGSSRTNLCLPPYSDLDFVLNLETHLNQKELNEVLKRPLISSGFTIIDYVDSARVAVLKLEHDETKTQVDITYNNKLPIFNSNLILRYIQMDERAFQLVLFVKYWAKQRGVCNTQNCTLSSYTWNILVIFFLQQLEAPLLPVLEMKVTDNACEIEDDYKGFDFHQNPSYVVELIWQFFVFFGTSNSPFSFDILRDTVDIANRINRNSNASSESTVPSRRPIWRMCIQDPIETDRDLASVIHHPKGQVFILNELNRGFKLLMQYRNVPSENGDLDTGDEAIEQEYGGILDEICKKNDEVPNMQIVCRNCNMQGHTRKTCPKMSCTTCGYLGHMNSNCPNKICYRCKGSHLSSECPLKPKPAPTVGSAKTWSQIVGSPARGDPPGEPTLQDSFQDVSRLDFDGEEEPPGPLDQSRRFQFEPIVLKWTVFDIVNTSLFAHELQTIPDTFCSWGDFASRQYPFVLEETRTGLHTQLTANVEGVPRFKFYIDFKGDDDKLDEIFALEDTVVYVEITIHGAAEWLEKNDIGPSFAMCVRNSPAQLSVTSLSSLSHVLIDVNFQREEDEPQQNNFTATLPTVSAARQLLENQAGWEIFLFTVGSLPSSRIVGALSRNSPPRFIDDILNGAVTYLESDRDRRARGLGKDPELLDVFTSSLNESQQDAVYQTLQVGLPGVPAVQLIKGPPGTGKTKTLVSLLRCLLTSNLRVHACAPTNVAVSELARRCFESLKSYSSSGEETLRYADFLLVGRKGRLKLAKEKDPLLDFLFDDRVKRLERAYRGFPLYSSSVTSHLKLIISVNGTKMDTTKISSENDAIEVIAAKVEGFMFNVSELQRTLSALAREAPKGSVFNLNLPDYLFVDGILQAILDLKNEALQQWMSAKPDPPQHPRGNASNKILTQAQKSNEDGVCSAPAKEGRIYPTLDELQRVIDVLRKITLKRRDNLKLVLLKEAKLVFSTVNVSGRELFNFVHFDVTVVDEATQLVQAETAILFRRQLKCLVLVGDDKQLPATVMSPSSQSCGYGTSLFSRLVAMKYPHSLLNIQYRMHPEISRWPRVEFYDGMVIDGDNVKSSAYSREWHSTFPPLSLFNLEIGWEQTHTSGSKYNEAEDMLVRHIIQRFRALNKGSKEVLTVGVVSPYKEQVNRLSDLACKEKHNLTIRTNTVDGFQGQECDIIIFSAVRSNQNGNIGFLSDERRLNVAVTRAKLCLIVICSVPTVSSNETWSSLISHATIHKHYRDWNTSDVIKKATNKWQFSENRLKQMLQPGSHVLEDSIWKLVFSGDFKKSLSTVEAWKKKDIMKGLINLSNGEWPKYELVCPLVPETLEHIIHVRQILHFRLVWSVDVDQVSCVQCIRVWDVVVEQRLANAIRRVESCLLGYSEAYLNRCAQSNMEGQIHYPCAWAKNIPVEWYRTTRSEKGNVEDGQCDNVGLERSNVSRSAVLMKFYSMSSSVARMLIQLKSGENIDLPFVMSAEEEAIVRHPGSALVMGRSGTGKTTAILHRMFLENKIRGEAEGAGDKYSGAGKSAENSAYRQLMVTASPILCEAIQRAYQNMCNTAEVGRGTKALTDVRMSVESNPEDALPISLMNERKVHFPLIITYSKFLRLVDATLQNPFFQWRSPGLGRIDISYESSDDDEYLEELGYAVSGVEADAVEVDFERFNSHYYPHFNSKLGFEASVVYTEIFSHIKGSLQALHSASGYLSAEEYLALSESRESSLDEKQRQKIFDAYLKYEQLKRNQYQDYDQLDLVHHLYKSLSIQPYRGVPMDSVFIDEVQDLTPAQISLFKFVCQNLSGFVFAGDTAQTIAHGVGFRFETVKDIFYHEFLDGSNNLDATEHMPKLWYLLQNFRTHAGIINLANSVVDLIMRFFPLSIDRMQPEASRVYGPLPIVLSDSSDFLGLFQKSTMHSCEFGAEQAILVRDEDTKRSVLEVSGHRALVLTVLEAKGMEFTDCLVYNFFGTSPLGNDWRVIYSQMETNEAHPEFNIQRHNLLCVELKLLYVLVTRARQHLLILDDSPTLMKPILDFWKLQNLVEMRDLDENIRAMFQSSSTPEEWRQRAEQLFERKQYGNARLCYQRAGDEYQERLCSSFEVEQEADNCVVRKPAEAKMLYKSAYESFKGLTGHMADAARCCEKAAEWLLAAEIYNNLGRFSQAGKCFEKKDAWTDAAIAYDRAQEYSDALRCCYKGYQFELALGFLGNMRISGKVPAEDVAKGENECNKKAALFYHANRDSNKMMEYVSRFSSTQEKRDFLKRYKYFEKLLDVEIADKCFQEAATVYEGLYNFEKAADLYEQGQLYGDMCRCVIRRLRCKYLGEDFTLNPLDDGDKALLEDISGKYLHTGKCSDSVYYQIEVDVLYALSGQPCVGESVAVYTSRNVAPPECVSNIPRSEHTLKSLYKRCEDLGDKTWRLQFHIVRRAVATSLAKKDWREAKVWCEKLDTIVVAVTRLLDKICQSNNVPRLSSVDKEILNHCLTTSS